MLSFFGYGYNASGMINSWTKQFGSADVQTSAFSYDGIDQLISANVAAGNSVMNYSYGYDLAGNRTREQLDASVTGSTYNTVNALTARAPVGEMEFTGTVNKWATVTLAGKAATVDSSGNWRGTAPVVVGANSIPLVAKDVNGNQTSKTISLTVSGGAGRTLAHDLNGNLINDGAGRVFEYDALNRLVSITQGGNVRGFVYNAFNQRVQETLNGTVIRQWVWNGGAQPVEERDAANQVTKRFYPQGEQIAGVGYYFTTDHLGSVREMTDASGAVRARYDYDPYGRPTKFAGDLESDFGYTGFYRHQSSGLNLTLYRAYDPELGRWLSRDPIGENGGINLYAYVGNDPVTAIDPLGLWQVELGYAYGYGLKLRFGFDPQSGKHNVGFSAGLGLGGGITFDPDEGSPFDRPGLDVENGFEANGQVEVGPSAAGLTFDASVKAGGKCGRQYDSSAGLKAEASPGIEKLYPQFGTWGLEGRIGVKGQLREVPMQGYGNITPKRSFGLGGMVFAGYKANFWW